MKKASLIHAFAFLAGLLAPLGGVASQAMVLSHLSPIYLVGLPIVSSLFFMLVSNYFSLAAIRFQLIAYSMIMICAGVLLNTYLLFNDMTKEVVASVWLITAGFLQPFSRWVAVELAQRFLNLQERDSETAKVIARFDIGSASMFSLYCIVPHIFKAHTILLVSSVGYVAVAVLLYWCFRRTWFNELTIGREENALPKTFFKDVRPIFFFYGALALCISLSKALTELATRNELSLQNREINSSYATFALIGLATVAFSALLEILISRHKKLRMASPSLFQFSYIAAAAIAIMITQFSSTKFLVSAWITAEILIRSTERSLVGHGNLIITNSFTGYPKRIMKIIQQLSSNILAPVAIVSLGGFFLKNSHDSKFVAGIGLALVASMVFVRNFQAIFTMFLPRLIIKGNNQERVLATIGFGRYYPQDTETFFARLLESNPSKLLKKAIALSLSRSTSARGTEILYKIFKEGTAEIQLTAVESIGMINTQHALKLLWSIAIEEEKSISQRVRMLAIDHVRRRYGKKAIPQLLDQLGHSDNRTVANMIEILSVFDDENLSDTFKRFTQHSEPRVVGNALIAMYPYRSTRKDWQKITADLLMNPDNPNKRASVLYAVGKVGAKEFAEMIYKLLEKPLEPVERRGAYIALARLGYTRLSLGIIKEMVDANYPKKTRSDAVYLFNSLPTNQRLDILDQAFRLQGYHSKHITDLTETLKHSSLDFHEEIVFLERLQFKQAKLVGIRSQDTAA